MPTAAPLTRTVHVCQVCGYDADPADGCDDHPSAPVLPAERLRAAALLGLPSTDADTLTPAQNRQVQAWLTALPSMTQEERDLAWRCRLALEAGCRAARRDVAEAWNALVRTGSIRTA